MKIQITNQKTGSVCPIDRSVTTSHPEWVHQQMGTASESELQRSLDGANVSDWYDEGAKHLGPDDNGLEMIEDDPEDTQFDQDISASAQDGRLASAIDRQNLLD